MQAKQIARLSSLVAVATLCAGTAFAEPARDATIQVAALSTQPTAARAESAMVPAHEVAVRAAAAEGPVALRRYVLRTRMIYGFYYNDFERFLPASI